MNKTSLAIILILFLAGCSIQERKVSVTTNATNNPTKTLETFRLIFTKEEASNSVIIKAYDTKKNKELSPGDDYGSYSFNMGKDLLYGGCKDGFKIASCKGDPILEPYYEEAGDLCMIAVKNDREDVLEIECFKN